MRRLISVIAVAVLTVALGVLSVGPEAAANDSNRDAAKRCQQGGWQTLVSDTGTPFTNQGDCVSTGAHGGLGVTPDPIDVAQQACSSLDGGKFVSPEGDDTFIWECQYASPPEPMEPPALIEACLQIGGLLTVTPGGDSVTADCN